MQILQPSRITLFGPGNTPINYQFVSGLLFTRGIIPSLLVDQISAITSDQKSTFGLFITEIWMPRNNGINTFEDSLGINSKDKKHSRTSTDLFYDKPILGPTLQQSLLKPWSYMKWMYNSIVFG